MAGGEPVGPATGRKERGDYPTPDDLVDRVVAATLPTVEPGQRVRVLDPACGDGRFLVAAGRRLAAAGAAVSLTGVDIEPAAVAAARARVAAAGHDPAGIVVGDGLADGLGGGFDVVVGNPPFRSPLSAGVAARGTGGPYADLAVAFLAAAVELARPEGGRIGLVLPQSVLTSRDAAPIRARLDAEARMVWSWWSPEQLFDASVVVCALVFERGAPVRPPAGPGSERDGWGRVVTGALGVPDLPPCSAAGTLGDRARLTANFRDHYYALVDATGDDADGPPLVSAGLIDPGVCHWGTRAVRLGGRQLAQPRVDLTRLSASMRRWADGLLVPKVLVANQTRVIEAVADPAGAWLPAVPVITARPRDDTSVDAIAAVLSSAFASCWAWHRAAGSGRSSSAIRLGPRWLAELPWPAGSLDAARDAARDGDLDGVNRAVTAAYDVSDDHPIASWWAENRPGAARLRADGGEA